MSITEYLTSIIFSFTSSCRLAAMMANSVLKASSLVLDSSMEI